MRALLKTPTEDNTLERELYSRYRDMGPERSVAKLWKELELEGKTAIGTLQTLYNWRSRHKWDERADEHERYIASVVDEQLVSDKIQRKKDRLETYEHTRKLCNKIIEIGDARIADLFNADVKTLGNVLGIAIKGILAINKAEAMEYGEASERIEISIDQVLEIIPERMRPMMRERLIQVIDVPPKELSNGNSRNNGTS